MSNIFFLSSFLFFFSMSIIAQPLTRQKFGDEPPVNPKPIYLETHVVPFDTNYICYVSYRIPFSNLVFTKDGKNYTAGVTLNIEAMRKEGKVIRSFTSGKAAVSDYSETEADEKYLQGILTFEVAEGKYELNPLLNIDNTDREIPLKPLELNVKPNDIGAPVVVDEIGDECGGEARFRLVNYEGGIPFGEEGIDLLIPLFINQPGNYKIEVEQYGKVVTTFEPAEIYHDRIHIETCGKEIIISNNPNYKLISYLLLDDVSALIGEGKVIISVSENDSLISEFEVDAIWPAKPRTLFEPKFAFELLELIADEDTLDMLLEKYDDNYQRALNEFWTNRVNGNRLKYNPLKSEFYNRADYALREFSSAGNRNGIFTDRGEIYIKYGKPSKIDRFYSDANQITELWRYDSLNLEFVFVDKTGLGNYRLKQ